MKKLYKKNEEHDLIMQRYALIVETAREAIIAKDLKGIIVAWNKGAEKMYGYKAREIIGKSVKVIFPKNKNNELSLILNKAKKGTNLKDFETTRVRKDGTVITVLLTTSILKNKNGHVVGLSVIGQDITKRKELEEKMRLSEERYKILVELSPESVTILNTSGIFKFLNGTSAKRFRLPANMLIGKSLWDFIPQNTSPLKVKDLVEVHKTKRPKVFHSWVKIGGKIRYYDIQLIPILKNTINSENLVMVISNDVTDIRLNQIKAENLSKTLEVVSKCNQALVHIFDEKRLIDEICRIIVSLGGYRFAWAGYTENNKNKSVKPISRFGFEEGYLKVAKITWADNRLGQGPTGTAIRTGKLAICRDTSKDSKFKPWKSAALKRKYTSSISLPIVINNISIGAISIYSSTANAFTKTQISLLSQLINDLSYGIKNIRAKNKMLETEKSLSTLLNFIPDATLAINKDGKVIYWNKSIEKMTGVTSKEMLGKSNHEYSLPFYNVRRKILIDLVSNADEKMIHKYNYIKKEGDILTTEANVPFDGTNPKILWAKAGPLYDVSGKVIGAIESIRDVTENRKNISMLKENEDTLRKIFDNSTIGISIVSTEGKWLKVNNSLCKITGYQEEELLSMKFAQITFSDDLKKTNDFLNRQLSGEIVNNNLEKRYVRKDGSIVWVYLSLSLVRDNNNKPLYFVVITEDITERKALDDAKTGFLSLASHQLRTPLSITKWVLESLLHEGSFAPKQMQDLNDLIYSNERLIKLVNDLLSVSTIDTGKLMINKKDVNFRKLIEDLAKTVKIFADKKKKNINIVIQEKIDKIFCDPIIVHEALENLITNAINYSTEDSSEIKIEVVDNEDGYIISVHNEGFMDSKLQEKLLKFEKFSRGDTAADKQKAGSGLGLYITKKIIEANGGSVWFESNATSGTTFYVMILKKINK